MDGARTSQDMDVLPREKRPPADRARRLAGARSLGLVVHPPGRRKKQKRPRFPAASSDDGVGATYARPACFITSAASSSTTFSMPSPTARRRKPTTPAPAALTIGRATFRERVGKNG